MPFSINPFTGNLDFKGTNYVVMTRTPTSADTISFAVPTIWVNSVTKKAYLLVSKDGGVAYWTEISGGGVDFLESVLSIADCTAPPPTEVLGDRYILDDTVGVIDPNWDSTAAKNDVMEFDGSVWIAYTPDAGAFVYVEDVGLLYVFDGTSWRSISVSIPDATETQKGVSELATDAESIAGTLTDNHVINPSSLKAKLGTQTAHGILVGAGTTTALTSIGVGNTGELLIGSTGADPSFGSIAYGDFSFSNITSSATPRTLSIINTDVNEASTADLRLSTPLLGGDSMVSWEIQTSSFFSAGIDNSDSDKWKLTNSSSPSSGTAIISADGTTTAVTFSEAYEFPIADGTAGYSLVTDGAGNLDFSVLTIAGGGTGASTLTDHAVLIGSGTGAITPITVGATGTVLIGSTGADPSFSATPTVTTINATTFDTNVASAGATLAGTTLSVDGTDANISLTLTAKGTGTINPNKLSVNSAYEFPTADGTADQVLTTDGSGAITWEDAGGTGGLELVSHQTASASASITFDNLTNVRYMLQIWNLDATTTTDTFDMYCSDDNGSTWKTAYKAGLNYCPLDTTLNYNRYPATSIPITSPFYATRMGDAVLYLSEANTAKYLYISGHSHWLDTTLVRSCYGKIMGKSDNTAINAIKFEFSSGTIASGEFALYKFITS